MDPSCFPKTFLFKIVFLPLLLLAKSGEHEDMLSERILTVSLVDLIG